MGYRTEPPPLPDEADDDESDRSVDWSNVGETQEGPSPLPKVRKGARDRSQWDWEYGLKAQPARLDWTEPEPHPGDDTEAIAEAAPRTGCIEI